MNTCNIFQFIPDREIPGSVTRLNILVIPQANPQPVRHLLLRHAFFFARLAQVLSHVITVPSYRCQRIPGHPADFPHP